MELPGPDCAGARPVQTDGIADDALEARGLVLLHGGRSPAPSPAQQEADGDPLSWNPANWFKPLWPGMRAFALPSVSDGYIRLNVRGREAMGLVEPTDFDAVLDALTELVLGLVNPHTGRAAVVRVVRTRRAPPMIPTSRRT